jgi:LCP family protein required for cell wall assembly
MKRLERSKKKKMKKKKIIIISCISVVFALLFAGSFYVGSLFNKVEIEPISQKPEDLGVTEEVKEKIEKHDYSEYITNIALFGVDKREKGESGRSDAIMILTIDKKRNKMKLTSIMRDSYASINGHGKDKINHAYAFGGPQLAVRTLNENFGLNIKDYVTVDFSGMEKIVDALGGITIDVKSYELKEINGHIWDLSTLKNMKKPPYLEGPGKQKLNGMQVVAYTRSRHSGNGDMERTDRQRRVIEIIFNQVKSAGAVKLPGIVEKFLPYVKTNMSALDMINTGKNVLTSGVSSLEQQRFPLNKNSNGQTINGVWYLVFDAEATKDQVFNYIFDDIKPTE